MKLFSGWRFPLTLSAVRSRLRLYHLQTQLNYGYVVAMGISVVGSLVGMVVGDFFQGRGIAQLHSATVQAALFREFRDHAEAAQLDGARFDLIIDSPEQIRSYKTRIEDSTTQVVAIGEDLKTFAQNDPTWLAASPAEIELIVQNYTKALDAQWVAIDTLLPNDQLRLDRAEQQAVRQELQNIKRLLKQSEIISVEWQLDRALTLAEQESLLAEGRLEFFQGIEKSFIVVSNLLSVALGGLFVMQLSKRLLRPIADLTQTTQAIRDYQDYSLRTPVTTDDEAGQLAQAFNELISEIEQQQQELVTAKEHAEAANDAKGIFLSTMTHELRTPLNAVLGYTTLLEKSPNLTPEEQGYLETVQRSGQHLLTLVSDVLDFSRMEAGKGTVNWQEVDLYELLQTLEALFALSAIEKNLPLHWSVAPDVPGYIHCDATKLRQILINLIGNALKFTTEGQILVTVTYRADTQDWLIIEVADTGTGIAPEELSTLFNPFTQTARGRNLQKGTGLGLALCRQFARLLGGDIRVQSVLHQGTTFTVELPITILQQDSGVGPWKPLEADPIFKESTPVRSAAALVSRERLEHLMGQPWCEEFFQAALAAEANHLETLIAQIPETQYAIAQQLHTWVEDYRYDAITDLWELENSGVRGQSSPFESPGS
jgi:signal transduction histidine kinase